MANKIELYLADEDDFYLNQLYTYILSKKSMFQLHIFSEAGALDQALQSNPARIDILAVSRAMNTKAVQQAKAGIKVLFSESESESVPEGYTLLNKFQKTETLIVQMMQMFELAGGQVGLGWQGADAAKLIGVYSPVGGSGKTALSLLLARAFAQSGFRAFYCNMEHISSFQGPTRPDMSLSQVLLAMQIKGANLELRIRTNMQQDERNGVYWFAAAESMLEWNEVDVAAKRRLLTTLASMGAFDVVVVDFDGELNEDKLNLLVCCDHVLMPTTEEDSAQRKIKAMANELNLRAAELSSLAGRIIYQKNKAMQGTGDAIGFDAAYTTLEQCWNRAPIPPVLLRLASEWGKR